MPIILTFGRLSHENCPEFKASLVYIADFISVGRKEGREEENYL